MRQLLAIRPSQTPAQDDEHLRTATAHPLYQPRWTCSSPRTIRTFPSGPLLHEHGVLSSPHQCSTAISIPATLVACRTEHHPRRSSRHTFRSRTLSPTSSLLLANLTNLPRLNNGCGRSYPRAILRTAIRHALAHPTHPHRIDEVAQIAPPDHHLVPSKLLRTLSAGNAPALHRISSAPSQRVPEGC